MIEQFVADNSYAQTDQFGINPVVASGNNSTIAGAGADTIFAAAGTGTTTAFNNGWGPGGVGSLFVAGAGTSTIYQGSGATTVYGGTGNLNEYEDLSSTVATYAGHGPAALTELLNPNAGDHVFAYAQVASSVVGANYGLVMFTDGARIAAFGENAGHVLAGIKVV